MVATRTNVRRNALRRLRSAIESGSVVRAQLRWDGEFAFAHNFTPISLTGNTLKVRFVGSKTVETLNLSDLVLSSVRRVA